VREGRAATWAPRALQRKRWGRGKKRENIVAKTSWKKRKENKRENSTTSFAEAEGFEKGA